MQRQFWLLIIGVVWCSAAMATLPPLQGSAVYQRLGTDMFRATVYSDQADWQSWTQPQTQLALEMRIVTDYMSARRFYRVWNEALAINLDDKRLMASAEPIGRFLRSVGGSLQPGDRLLVSNLDGVSRITVNDIQVLEWADPALVPLLANAWVGRFPYSPSFKEQLTGLDPADRHEAMVAVESIQPQVGRDAVIQGWLQPVAATAAVSAAAVSKPAASTSAPKTKPKAPVNKPTAPAKKVVAKTEPTPAAKAAAKSPASKPASEPVVADAATVAAQEPSTEKAALEGLDAAVNEAAEQLAEAAAAEQAGDERQNLSPEAVADSSEQPAASAGEQADEVVQVATVSAPPAPSTSSVDWAVMQMVEIEYYRTLISMATRAVRYPKRALMRGQEGEVRVLVKLAPSGSVLSLETAVSSNVEVLDRAARKAVEDAAPYPPAPRLLSDDMLEFELPFRFALTN
ncbi:hypothetical protein CHH28_16560 [Bacterioplanes sanyensis]|uniref:TonB C-terminal domain-containing protein n=1 Tax=Bacterioplanes sanyensis TaxID=1249553 RepID=A0A222FME0_9GAMM|nr:energy transducer TonB [Bacterioplanes sanyensis]ASP40188.1 hypothetical protein CHH28_16560 [Bacterioplanes sanyensis]